MGASFFLRLPTSHVADVTPGRWKEPFCFHEKRLSLFVPLPRLLRRSVVKGASSERSVCAALLLRAKNRAYCSKGEDPEDETELVSSIEQCQPDSLSLQPFRFRSDTLSETNVCAQAKSKAAGPSLAFCTSRPVYRANTFDGGFACHQRRPPRGQLNIKGVSPPNNHQPYQPRANTPCSRTWADHRKLEGSPGLRHYPARR